jgi:hypothetical protein
MLAITAKLPSCWSRLQITLLRQTKKFDTNHILPLHQQQPMARGVCAVLCGAGMTLNGNKCCPHAAQTFLDKDTVEHYNTSAALQHCATLPTHPAMHAVQLSVMYYQVP